MSGNRKDQIGQIFTRMSQLQRQLSSADLSDEQYHDGFASWYMNDPALMASCKNGTFQITIN